MNALGDTLTGMQQPSFGKHVENTAAMDLFVLLTLGFLFFLLGCFATWAWLIWRRGNRLAPHVQLLMEMNEQESAPKRERKAENPKEPEQQASEEEESAPWERPGDWWKQP